MLLATNFHFLTNHLQGPSGGLARGLGRVPVGLRVDKDEALPGGGEVAPARGTGDRRRRLGLSPLGEERAQGVTRRLSMYNYGHVQTQHVG